ncbi:hypothetical protein FOZ63_000900, partial [Perkinsus olseni]
MDTPSAASAAEQLPVTVEYGSISVRVEDAPFHELFERVGRSDPVQETVYEYIPPDKVPSGGEEEPETEVMPVAGAWEAWGDCAEEKEEDGIPEDRRRARVDRLERDLDELRHMMKAYQQRLAQSTATSRSVEQDEDVRVEELIEQLQSMRSSALDGGSPLAGEEGDALWHQQASTERMEMLERKVCLLEAGLGVGRLGDAIGGGGLRIPITTLLCDLSRQVSILEAKRPPGEEEVAATCAALDLLLEKQAELEATIGVSSEEIDAIERLYDMCEQGQALGAEVMAVAKGLRDMR